MPAKTKLIITVGCEYGCRGPEIAQRIADDLGIPCYDRDLIDDIIEEAGFSKDLLDKAEKGHAIRGRDTGDVDPKKLGAIRYHNLTDRVVFLQRETVRRLAPAPCGCQDAQCFHLCAERCAPQDGHARAQPRQDGGRAPDHEE